MRRAVSGVTVSGLQISGFPVGVLIAGGERTAIEDNQIDGTGPYGILATNSARTRYADNTIVHGLAGVAGVGACAEGSTGSTIAGNDVSGFITGLCISSSQVGVRGNRVHDNHFGIFTDPGYHDIDIQDNQVEHNTRGAPFPLPTGIGIIVDGSHDVTIRGNRVSGNLVDNSGFGLGAGGVLVVDEPGVAVASNVVVRHNVLTDNGDGSLSADLWIDTVGTGNVFAQNDGQTSHPGGLC